MVLLSIRDAALQHRSAIVRVGDDRGAVGAVALLAGRLAWATSRDHDEDLAGYLVRRAGIDERLAVEIRRELNAPASLDALAARLEADAAVSRERLRALRLEHLRAVIASIRPRGRVRPQVADWSGAIDSSWTYDWEEVFFEEDGRIVVRPA